MGSAAGCQMRWEDARSHFPRTTLTGWSWLDGHWQLFFILQPLSLASNFFSLTLFMASPEVAPVDIHARIHAFESLSKPTSPPKSSVKSSPNLLDTPNSPSSKSYRPIAPATNYATYKKAEKRSPSPSPPILGRKTSLIDLKDWVLDDGLSSHDSPSSSLSKTSLVEEFGAPSPPLPRVPGRVVSDSSWRLHSSASTSPGTPLINLDTTTLSSKPVAPPLPPRKASYGSLKSVSVSNSSSSSLPRSPAT